MAAVVRASISSTYVAAALSGTGPLAVFAPTKAAGFATIADIQAANTLAFILTSDYAINPAHMPGYGSTSLSGRLLLLQ